MAYYHPHHAFLRTAATLSAKDKCTEWWTVRNEAKLYAVRDFIPFSNLYANDHQGGFIVYLDKPRTVAP